MNWDALAAIGEVIGAGAVLATLAFLAVQIRDGKRVQQESNALARSAAGDKAYDHFSGFRRLLAADADVTRIWMAGCAGESLDEIERERFRQLAQEYLFTFAMWINRMNVVGLPAVAEGATVTLIRELHERPGLRAFWAPVADQISPATRTAISDALSSQSK